MIRVKVSLADAEVTERETITTGRVGLECAFSFSDDWNGYSKTAVFRACGAHVNALVTDGKCFVPADVLAEPNALLWLGVYGTKDELVLPTVWCKIGKIFDGTKPATEEDEDEGTSD